VSPPENIPSAPSFVKTLEHGCRQEAANLNLFNHSIPCGFGVNDESIPNPVLDLRLVPLFMIEHFVVAFNPNGPKCNTPKEVPYLKKKCRIFGNPFSKQCLFPIEPIVIAISNPTKFKHSYCGPSPHPPSLDAVPNFMLVRLACTREAKITLLGD
jgi:hypothetical protein